jgi:transcription antitermination factor NusG
MAEKEIWCIAYINRDYISIVKRELKQYNYDMVEAYIPTVKILKKTFKGKQEFQEVPLLFNYGFFKMPFNYACNEEFLSQLRQRLTCLYGWVKDCSKVIEDKPELRMDNDGMIIALPRTAIATDKEVSILAKTSMDNNVYSADDLANISEGDCIMLHGYPFDNIPAQIVKINYKKKEVKVKLLLEVIMKNVSVSFDNVFYTVYNNFDENTKDKSLNEIDENGINSIDKIFAKLDYNGEQ